MSEFPSSQQSSPESGSSAAVRTTLLHQTVRETIESVVVAVILAFLFRGFVAEAFVIPTGSMAPTLQGRHMDVICAECGFQYRTGASVENEDFGPARDEVTHTRCPLCLYTMELDKPRDLNQRSFNGDRILVSKFSYAFREPQRWDVIVFKYPGNAKINYIKRLAGLPGETLEIRHGDLYVQPSGAPVPGVPAASVPVASVPAASSTQPAFQMARKPPDKVLAMLQLVHDSRYDSPQLSQAGWPSRWVAGPGSAWQAVERGFQSVQQPEPSWLRYRHLVPRAMDWRAVNRGEPLPEPGDYQGRLITDYYAYNESLPRNDANGDCWVGDLAVECEIDVRGGDGELILDLVEGGTHYRCTIAVPSGQATLSIADGNRAFIDEAGHSVQHPTANTALRGRGRYDLRFANVDDQLHLWVNGTLVRFEGPTTFVSPRHVAPRWTPKDPGDLQPVGIGARNLLAHVRSLRVLRDVYYRAAHFAAAFESEYQSRRYRSPDDIDAILSHPEQWESTDLFASRRSATFTLGPDQFFPLGDNSPQSKDARLWSNPGYPGEVPDPPPYVDRNLLIGRALAIYWPHGWRVHSENLGIIPNFQRISLIR